MSSVDPGPCENVLEQIYHTMSLGAHSDLIGQEQSLELLQIVIRSVETQMILLHTNVVSALHEIDFASFDLIFGLHGSLEQLELLHPVQRCGRQIVFFQGIVVIRVVVVTHLQ